MSKREVFQLYSSPYWAMFEVLNWYKNHNFDRLKELVHHTWFEPCAGQFALTKATAFWCGQNDFTPPKWITNDLDPDHGADTCVDAKDKELWLKTKPAVAVTNPPFGVEGSAIVEKAVKHSSVAWMLLRLTFLECTKPREWLVEFPPDKLIILPRYSFERSKKNPDQWGVDRAPCIWVLWDKTIQENRPIFLRREQIEYFYKNPEQGARDYPQLFD